MHNFRRKSHLREHVEYGSVALVFVAPRISALKAPIFRPSATHTYSNTWSQQMLETSCTPAINSTPRIIRGISIELNLEDWLSCGLACAATSRLNARAQIDQRFFKKTGWLRVLLYYFFNNIILVKVSMSFLLISSQVNCFCLLFIPLRSFPLH